MTETDEQCSPLQKIALPHHTAIQQQKPLTPGEVAAKPTERVYSYPKCGRSKRPILLLLPHHTALVILVCVPATDEMPAWQAFQFSAVPRTTTYFLLPFSALARLAERIGWSQTSPYEIVRSPIVRLCALNAPTLASLTDGSCPRLRRGQQHAAWRRLRACEVTEGVFIRTPQHGGTP